MIVVQPHPSLILTTYFAAISLNVILLSLSAPCGLLPRNSCRSLCKYCLHYSNWICSPSRPLHFTIFGVANERRRSWAHAKHVFLTSSVFWDITQCRPLKVNRHFGEICRLELQGRRICQARNKRDAGNISNYRLPHVGLSTGYRPLYPRR
jgi:hypothetical protein